MRITGPIALASLPPIPWKNGGGITRTLAVEPPQAGMDDFLWRISIADLHASGSFSSFPQIDRTILLWQGADLTLRSPSWPNQRLSTTGEPFAFAGEDEVHCELSNGPSQDLNLMVRRGAVSAALKLCRTQTNLNQACEDLFVLCAEGTLQIRFSNDQQQTLPAGHLLRISQLQTNVTLDPFEAGTRFVYISIAARASSSRP